MESVSTFGGLATEFQGIVTQVLAYLPRIGAAILVLLLGWLLARVLRSLVINAIGRFDQFWQRFRGLENLRVRNPPSRVVGELLFWLLILIFITLATEILGLGVFGIWLKEIVTYFPLVIAGLLIMLAGYVLGAVARDLITSAAASANLAQGELLGRMAQIIILFITIIIGVDQIGIDIVFLSVLVGIVLASMLGGIALAFGLGARTHVSNIIAANQLRQIYQVGDKVRIGNIEGLIVDIRMSRVLVETDVGSVDVPAKLFDEEVTIITEKGS